MRCISRRERCSADGSWIEEDFVCTTEVSGSTEFPMACAVKADGRLTCFGLATNDFFAPQFRSRIPVGTFVDVDVADELNGGAASRAAVCATDATAPPDGW